MPIELELGCEKCVPADAAVVDVAILTVLLSVSQAKAAVEKGANAENRTDGPSQNHPMAS